MDHVFNPPLNEVLACEVKAHSDGSNYVCLSPGINLAAPIRPTTPEEQQYLKRFFPEGVPWILAGHTWWKPPAPKSPRRRNS